FPYTAFRNINDADMQALYAYLMSQPAVKQPAQANQMSFPFNIRPLMAGWNALFLGRGEYQADLARSEQWNRGAYLVNGLGHCAACHSPRNLLGAEKGGQSFLAGGMVDGWEAPPLSGLRSSATPWTEAELTDYLSNGFSERHGVAAGPMGPVVSELAMLPKSDVQAIANYLISLDAPAPAQTVASSTAPDPAALARGQRTFEGACQACHSDGLGPQLFGVSPSMAVNSNVHSRMPDNLLKVILHGIDTPATPELGYMPAFKDSFNDRQVAELVAYLRHRFASEQPAWLDLTQKVAHVRANPGTH
ncbi:c-type cytochrome, partial [Pseudomonas fulva]